jgi:two-component sensor histidine kinase
MMRLATFDVSRQFVSQKAKLSAQVAFGVFCALATIGIRALFDIWAPTSGPFALVYPTVLLATLYGHWRAGLTAFLLLFFWAWYYVLPAPGSLAFTNPTDLARVAINAAACLIVLVFAEAFRRAARATMNEISKAADRRLTLLAELEHRTKNNFALVASMLELQKRTIADEALHAHLDDAAGRVRTFAEAYSGLAEEQAEDSAVAIKPYLDILLDRLESAAMPDQIHLYREIDALDLSREEAVAIGLYVNEALSNSLKYAFPDGRRGTIGVYFHVSDAGWRLAVEDDGVGAEVVPSPAGSGGLGSKLMGAFAAQAGAEHTSGAVLKGFRAEMNKAFEQVQEADRQVATD